MKGITKRQVLGRAIVCSFILILFFSTAQANLVGLWKFEELAGDVNVLDSSTFGNNGILVAGPNDPCSPLISTLPKRINNVHSKIGNHGLEFGTPTTGTPTVANPNRNWNYVQVPNSTSLKNLGMKWTIAFWAKQYTRDPNVHYAPGGGSGYQRVVSCPTYEIEMGVPADLQDYFWPFETPAWEMPIGASQTLNAWHHFALTYDGTTLRRYADGTEIFSTTDAASQALPANWGEEFLMFAVQTFPIKDFFIGALDEIAIFNECLDVTEIATIKNSNFTGPWETFTYESQNTDSYLWDWTFISQTSTIPLNPGEKHKGSADGIGIPSWNWRVTGNLSDPNKFGLVNAGALDGSIDTYEYAAYIPVGNILSQPKPEDSNRIPPFAGDFKDHGRIHKDTRYNFKTRFAGQDANSIGNIIGVRIYAADVNDPNIKTLLADLNQTVTASQVWYSKSTVYTADAATYPDNSKTFYAECYVNQGTGNANGIGWFDYVLIDVNEFLTCDALYAHYNGVDPCLPNDLTQDCRVNFDDYVEFAVDWMNKNNPEPIKTSTELLTNGDFYSDLSIVPAAGNSDKATPTGWSFVPARSDVTKAGIWNVSAMGRVHTWDTNPAGGSVAAFIDPNTDLQQVTSTTIVSGQKYYLSAMLGGVASSYLNQLSLVYEYINTPVSPTTIVEIARQDYILPDSTVWRMACNEWTAPSGAAGMYFRVRAEYGPPAGFTPANTGWGLIGNVSIDTAKPSYWQRSNLLTNGDFEDYSNLPMGTPGDTDGWINLFDLGYGWTWNFQSGSDRWPPGWTFQDEYPAYAEGGLQCMFWAPAPQPAHGRTSVVIGTDISTYPDANPKIDQKVTSETIQSGQTYYLDFIGCISASNYNTGYWAWPQPDPNLVVELYWLNTGQNNIYSGTQGVDWGFITTLKQPADDGMGARGGHWQKASTSFTASPSLAGKSFFVRAYGEAPYATFEEIYLSKEPPVTIGAYICAEQAGLGNSLAMDFNGDCVVNFKDLDIFVSHWLECNDPAGCD